MLSFSCYVCLVCTGNTMLYGRVFLSDWRLFWRVSGNVSFPITIKGVLKTMENDKVIDDGAIVQRELITHLVAEWPSMSMEWRCAVLGVLDLTMVKPDDQTIVASVVNTILKSKPRQLAVLHQLLMRKGAPVDAPKAAVVDDPVHASIKVVQVKTTQEAVQRLFLSPLLLPILYQKSVSWAMGAVGHFTSSTGFKIYVHPDIKKVEVWSDQLRVPPQMFGQSVDLLESCVPIGKCDAVKLIPEDKMKRLRQALGELVKAALESKMMKTPVEIGSWTLTAGQTGGFVHFDSKRCGALVAVDDRPEKTVTTTRRLLFISPQALDFLDQSKGDGLSHFWQATNGIQLRMCKSPSFVWEWQPDLRRLWIPADVAGAEPVDLALESKFRQWTWTDYTWTVLSVAVAELNQIVVEWSKKQ